MLPLRLYVFNIVGDSVSGSPVTRHDRKRSGGVSQSYHESTRWRLVCVTPFRLIYRVKYSFSQRRSESFVLWHLGEAEPEQRE
jgi:hypothetical protein